MRRIIIIVVFQIIIVQFGFAQNDTLFLEHDFIKINNNEYNKIENGLKNGNWIEYKIIDNSLNIIQWSGDHAHGTKEIIKEYRPLFENEVSGQLILIKSDSIVVKDNIYYNSFYKSIENKIPPDIYTIISKGKYINGFKDGIWKYYHLDGQIKKEIRFKKGKPIENFKIYRDNGTLMISVEIKESNKFKICKFSEKEKLIKCELLLFEEIKLLL